MTRVPREEVDSRQLKVERGGGGGRGRNYHRVHRGHGVRQGRLDGTRGEKEEVDSRSLKVEREEKERSGKKGGWDVVVFSASDLVTGKND